MCKSKANEFRIISCFVLSNFDEISLNFREASKHLTSKVRRKFADNFISTLILRCKKWCLILDCSFLIVLDSKNNSLAYTFVDMIMASSNSEKNEHEIDSNEETQSHALRARKRSILQKFVAAIFYDDENNSGHNQSQSNTEEKAKNPESEDTKTRMISEVQHLNRDRKKSLLVRVFNGLLFRIQNDEQELPIGSIEDQDGN